MSSPNSSPSNVSSSSLRCLAAVLGRGGSSPIGSAYDASIIHVNVLRDASLQYNSLFYYDHVLRDASLQYNSLFYYDHVFRDASLQYNSLFYYDHVLRDASLQYNSLFYYDHVLRDASLQYNSLFLLWPCTAVSRDSNVFVDHIFQIKN